MSQLILHTAPADAHGLVQAELRKIPPHSYGGTDFSQVNTRELHHGIHFPVFEADVDKDSGDIKIEPSHRNGSGFLVRHKEKIVAAVFVSTDRAGENVASVKQIAFGPFVENFNNALHDAEDITPYGEFEPRLLRVSGLCTNLLWLVSLHNNAQDWYLPVAPTPEFLTGKQYTAATLAAALSPVSRAMKSAAADSAPGVTAHAP